MHEEYNKDEQLEAPSIIEASAEKNIQANIKKDSIVSKPSFLSEEDNNSNHSDNSFNRSEGGDKVIIEDIIEIEPTESPTKRQIVRDVHFNPTTRVNEMTDLFEKRFSMEINFEPEKILDIEPAEELRRAVTTEDFPRTRRASMRILYLAKYLEERLYNKKDEMKEDKPTEDNVLQMLLDKPSIKTGKKVSRGSIKLLFS
jgi:hypothetical protein